MLHRFSEHALSIQYSKERVDVPATQVRPSSNHAMWTQERVDIPQRFALCTRELEERVDIPQRFASSVIT